MLVRLKPHSYLRCCLIACAALYLSNSAESDETSFIDQVGNNGAVKSGNYIQWQNGISMLVISEQTLTNAEHVVKPLIDFLDDFRKETAFRFDYKLERANTINYTPTLWANNTAPNVLIHISPFWIGAETISVSYFAGDELPSTSEIAPGTHGAIPLAALDQQHTLTVFPVYNSTRLLQVPPGFRQDFGAYSGVTHIRDPDYATSCRTYVLLDPLNQPMVGMIDLSVFSASILTSLPEESLAWSIPDRFLTAEFAQSTERCISESIAALFGFNIPGDQAVADIRSQVLATIKRIKAE